MTEEALTTLAGLVVFEALVLAVKDAPVLLALVPHGERLLCNRLAILISAAKILWRSRRFRCVTRPYGAETVIQEHVTPIHVTAQLPYVLQNRMGYSMTWTYKLLEQCCSMYNTISKSSRYYFWVPFLMDNTVYVDEQNGIYSTCIVMRISRWPIDSEFSLLTW